MKFLRKSVTVEPDTRNVLSKKGICGNRIPLKVRCVCLKGHFESVVQWWQRIFFETGRQEPVSIGKVRATWHIKQGWKNITA